MAKMHITFLQSFLDQLDFLELRLIVLKQTETHGINILITVSAY